MYISDLAPLFIVFHVLRGFLLDLRCLIVLIEINREETFGAFPPDLLIKDRDQYLRQRIVLNWSTYSTSVFPVW